MGGKEVKTRGQDDSGNRYLIATGRFLDLIVKGAIEPHCFSCAFAEWGADKRYCLAAGEASEQIAYSFFV